MRRPSPALIVAIVALVVACAGSATAATLITGRQIRNGSVTGIDVKDRSLRGKDVGANTMTGRNVSRLSGRDIIPNGIDGSDIDEGTLDAVPNATHAASATTAATAQRADALTHALVHSVIYNQHAGTGPVTIVNEGGLRISAECGAGSRLTATVT